MFIAGMITSACITTHNSQRVTTTAVIPIIASMKTIDRELLDNYVHAKYLTTQKVGPLRIYNYTGKCNSHSEWTPVTLRMRGFIIEDATNTIIAQPMPKFFDMDKQMNIDWSKLLRIEEKIDGHLGVLFNYHGQWMISSRGRLDSFTATVASKLLYSDAYDLSALPTSITYCVEVVHPDLRVVVPYDNAELRMLCAFDTATGNEIDQQQLLLFSQSCHMRLPQRHEPATLGMLSRLMHAASSSSSIAEGFVLCFEHGFRLKAKLPRYLQLLTARHQRQHSLSKE